MKIALLIIPFFFLQKDIFSQRIVYSEPGNSDSVTISLEVIGKMKSNYLIYDHTIGKQTLDVYDDKMNLKKTLELSFLRGKAVLYLNFIPYPDFCLAVFQAVEKGMVYCKVAKIDEDGNLVETKSIDSARFGLFRGGELYSVSVSENKKYILFNRPLLGLRDSALQLDEVTMDASLTIKRNEHYFIPFLWKTQSLSNTAIDNNGNVFFFTWKSGKLKKITITFYKSPANGLDLVVRDITINKYKLDEPKGKMNNDRNTYYFISFYKESGSRKGFLTMILNSDLSDNKESKITTFTKDENKLARNNRSTKQSIDDYFLGDVILKNDGGFVVTTSLNRGFSFSEPHSRSIENDKASLPEPDPNVVTHASNSDYTYSDYLYANRYLLSANSAVLPEYEDNPNLAVSRSSESLIYQSMNVMTFSFDKNNHSFATSSLNSLAPAAIFKYYNIAVLDSQVMFIYNNFASGVATMHALSVFSDGSAILNPPFKDFNADYTFFPGHAKQVDEKTIIIPCKKDEHIVMAKIIFE